MPKLPTKSGSETLEAVRKVVLEAVLRVRLEVELEVRLEVGLEVRLEVELVGICFPLVSSPIAPKQLSWSKRSLNCFREKLFKSLPLTISFNNLSILVVDDSAVVIGVAEIMANKLEKGKGIQGSQH